MALGLFAAASRKAADVIENPEYARLSFEIKYIDPIREALGQKTTVDHLVDAMAAGIDLDLYERRVNENVAEIKAMFEALGEEWPCDDI